MPKVTRWVASAWKMPHKALMKWPSGPTPRRSTLSRNVGPHCKRRYQPSALSPCHEASRSVRSSDNSAHSGGCCTKRRKLRHSTLCGLRKATASRLKDCSRCRAWPRNSSRGGRRPREASFVGSSRMEGMRSERTLSKNCHMLTPCLVGRRELCLGRKVKPASAANSAPVINGS